MSRKDELTEDGAAPVSIGGGAIDNKVAPVSKEAQKKKTGFIEWRNGYVKSSTGSAPSV